MTTIVVKYFGNLQPTSHTYPYKIKYYIIHYYINECILCVVLQGGRPTKRVKKREGQKPHTVGAAKNAKTV